MRLQYPKKYKSSQNINIIQKHNIFTFINEFERGVTFTFGKLTSIKKSGLRLFIPSIQQLYRVDLRTRVRELPGQLIITKDNVSASINAVVYYQVVNAKESVLKVDNVDSAIQQLGQTELRDFLCQKSFSEILDSREELSEAIHKVMKDRAQIWGVEVEYLQLKNIDLTQENMIRAMAKEAEASREKKAAMIRADGEFEAAKKLRDASNILRDNPLAIELRRLQTLESLSKEPNQNTVVVPDEVLNNRSALIGAGIASGVLNKDNIIKFDDEDTNLDDRLFR